MSDLIRILIADDDATFLTECLSQLLKGQGDLKIDSAVTPKECLWKVIGSSYDVVVLDISFSHGGMEGLDLITDIRALRPDADIIMLSSIDDRSIILKAMERGANNYVIKSLSKDVEEIVLRIRSALAQKRFKRQAIAEGEILAKSVGAVYLSSKMRQVFSLAFIARRTTNQNILITGPTGVGKDVLANALSRSSDGAKFVAVNCGAISPSILESELFGYAKGAFTGAVKDRPGLFEEADGGDVFLDEVATLSQRAQVALLRILQTGEFNRVGSNETRKTKVRIIAATNEDLQKAVDAGAFREDLLARINGIKIAIPPLQERREDIKPIIEYLVAKSDKPKLTFTPDCLAFLEAYSWPQNVRQLRSVIDTMIAFANSDYLTIGDIPKEILNNLNGTKSSSSSTIESLSEQAFNIPIDLPFDKALQIFQVKFIDAKLKKLNGRRNVTALAEALSVPRSTLARKLEELGINMDDGRNRINNL